ncbi:MFS transporter [Epilithonimonas sp.]|uniref:MFS transporter n=1 Tax=Epilithonimonas sp. TaxID=2894511 RepID=UPI0028AE8923|nr:MFS transporter [Epilithonimonas sp.]
MDATIDKNKNLSNGIISYVFFTFIGYFIIGLSLSVLPIFINKSLGFSMLVAGVVISLQYVMTFILRAYSGKVIDSKGPKPAVLASMLSFSFTGLGLVLAYYFRLSPVVSLLFLIITRFFTGCAEGLVGASPINWAIMTFGEEHTAKIISYNGIASYGALALGASLGVIIVKYFSFYGLGIIILLLGLVGFVLARTKDNCTGIQSEEEQKSFWNVLGKVAPFGLCLAMGGLGFATISTFVTLYYDYYHWQNGALCLSVFGILFVAGRLVFSNAINRFGGINVAIVCLAVETLGLVIITLSSHPYLALIGAGITGLGFSLIFPALGVMAMKTVHSSNQGSALAGYGLFIDISLGITGPLIGGVADQFGLPYIFRLSVGIVLLGLILAYYLKVNQSK